MPLPNKPSRPTLPGRPVRKTSPESSESPERSSLPIPGNRLPTRSNRVTEPIKEEDYDDNFFANNIDDSDDFSFGGDSFSLNEDNDNTQNLSFTNDNEDEYEDDFSSYDESEPESQPIILDDFAPTEDETFGVSDPNENFYGSGEFSEEFAMDFGDYEIEDEDSENHLVLVNNAINSLEDENKEAAENFFELLDNDEISEISLRGPKKVVYKKKGRRLHAKNVSFNSTESYHNFINSIILGLTDTSERIDGTNHLIEGRLTFPSPEDNVAPLSARVHIVTPPVVNNAIVTLAKKSRIQYTLDDMVRFETLTPNMKNFLEAVARGKATTVFSGVSGAGKTTLIESMAYYFDPDDSVVVVEDTPELRIQYGNVVSLTANTPKPGMKDTDIITMEWLVKATNRMRPDRIIVGECRGGEFSEFLIAANSGADGSMTTIHAANPRLAIQKMVSLALKNGTSKSEEATIRDISSTVQIIVQADLIDGKHIISKIEEVSSTVTSRGNLVGTQTLFEYDRTTQRHVPRNQPSDDLREFLKQRGVEIENSWFRH